MSDDVVKMGASNEILGAMLSADAVLSELKADAKGYIFGHYNIDLGEKNVVIAENNSSTVHLVLPYYAGLEKLSASAVTDDDTHDVVGAEIVAAVTLALTVGGFIISVGGVAASVLSDALK